jgi:hypothetical protein
MPDLMRLSLADLWLLMDMKEAEEQKRAEEEVRCKAAEEEVVAKAKARKVTAAKKWKAAEVESGSEVEPRPSQKKGKGKARATRVGSTEEVEDACLR